jgi:hypothetical protein
VTWRLQAGIVESEEMSIARQLLGKRVPVEKDTYTTVEVVLGYDNNGKGVSMWFVQKCYKKVQSSSGVTVESSVVLC